MRPIKECLNPGLAKICYQAMTIDKLNNFVTNFLPNDLGSRCTVCSFSRGCLSLITTEPAWAAQLRFCLPDLRDKLRRDAQLYQLVSIKIDISYPDTPVKKVKKGIFLSTKVKEIISSASENCDYLPLKTALKDLAR